MQIQIDHSRDRLAARQSPPPGADPAASGMRALMWLNAERVAYVGLLGAPSVRTLGACSIYLSLNVPHRISIDGGPWQSTGLSVVPPQVPHRIGSGERMICNLLVETETVAPGALPEWLRDGRGAVESPALLAELQGALRAFRNGEQRYARTADFDRAFFGAPLGASALDRRIAAVLERIRLDPDQPHAAKECAAAIHVSVSRFLHLFKAEVGVPFRSYRTWQRARSVLYYVTRTANLASIALDMGYPDSTHFSHSVRQVYGLTPKSIFAGCRRLELHGREAAT